MIDKNQYQYLVLRKSYRRYTTSNELSISVVYESESDEKNISHGSYGALLFDPRWKLKRQGILDRDNHKCILCRSQSGLQVHHRQYHFYKAKNKFKPPWDYNDNLLITLCEKCHQRGHRQYKVPTIYI